ncbi:4Fe-4S binding protein [Maledivibacter halophilus]|uniref:4Fe-4S binding domain-containing protein n=1 Tax=Maledivibacter halophilus TaxID=36842 RepID=A0A1T5IK55_9FIRM|nr:4Fe-4S binding protein [Maledivibacter halophilus]SKC39584.1 4Fe-4S binding domain-containing protein [Maledivibacter halophilus]
MKLKVDASTCSGCGACKLVCALKNFKDINPCKAALNVKGFFPSPGKYNVEVCNQCGACAEACPVDAIYLEDGVYLINEDECINCMNCVEACPTGVMMTHKDVDVPFKCTNCGECVSLCPRGVLSFEK